MYGRVADREYAEVTLSAFVHRCVDVGDASADHLCQALSYRADVHPHDGVDGARRDQRIHEALDRHLCFDGGVDQNEPNAPSSDAVASIELARRDLRAGDA